MYELRKKAPPHGRGQRLQEQCHVTDESGYTVKNSNNQIDCTAIIFIWRRQRNATHFCIWTAVKISKAEPAGDRKHHWFTPDQFGDVKALVARFADTHNVYACPCGFREPSRQEGSEADTTLAYADMDAIDPRRLPPELHPHMAIESSPGRYVGVWLFDGTVPAELNQRLTYHIGADKGGWAANKLLRLIPGTINHKYPDKPRVRLLWDETTSRPLLPVGVLEALPPAGEQQKATAKPSAGAWSNGATASDADRAALVEQYAARRDMLRQQLDDFEPWPSGKRSVVTWKWIKTLMERGAADDEVFVMIEPCGFNKYTAAQLRRQIDKARAEIERRA